MPVIPALRRWRQRDQVFNVWGQAGIQEPLTHKPANKQTSETNSMSSYRKTILEADAEDHCSLNSTGLRGVSVGPEHRALWDPMTWLLWVIVTVGFGNFLSHGGIWEPIHAFFSIVLKGNENVMLGAAMGDLTAAHTEMLACQWAACS